MSNFNDNTPGEVLDSLKRSGFPFQTAITHVIRSAKDWSVHASEYPWRGPKNDDMFLDIVAVSKQLILTIECKKTAKETFTFLLPLGGVSTGHIEEFHCLCGVPHYTQGKHDVRWHTWKLSPQSSTAEFCIVGNRSGGNQRLLERDGSLLVSATDAFAGDLQGNNNLNWQLPYLVVPVIVTNAKLYATRYEPTKVSLESGGFEHPPTDIENVPWIRFSKTFGGRDFAPRSIFVVNSMSFEEFLGKLEISPTESALTATARYWNF